MDPAAPRPFVITLALAPEDQAWFEAARRRHFPPERNLVPAHVSLFHALPGEHAGAVRAALAGAARSQRVFPVQVEEVRRYGSGVGYQLAAAPLQTLHAQLRSAWLPWLTAQDRQGFRPHVMVQNKAPAEQTSALLATLKGSFIPWTITATGLSLWEYRGGPWELMETMQFTHCEEEP